VTDPEEIEVLFLHRHPGWTWTAMQETPLDIIEGLMLLDQKLTS
jgi:hypothetical protein